jgi:peptidoglycan/LPS O-acetylase OafA/YrhL
MRFNPFQRSIADYAALPANNYTLLRFLAALMVIYGHSYAVTRLPGERDLFQRLLHFTYSGALGVDVFFVISGFLVTASYLNRQRWGEFMKSRCLRIFPGLIVCMLLTMFVLGPVVSSLGAADYFMRSDLYVSMFRGLSRVDLHFRLPGVFEHLPLDGVNGSLWTLPIEFLLYVLLGCFGLAGLLLKRRWYGVFILALCLVAVAATYEVHFFADRVRFLPLFILFGVGSVMRVYSDRIPLSGGIMLALAVPAVLAYRSAVFPHLFTLWLVYAVFWAAYVPKLHWFNRVGDYSYGLYIYAFPIEQTLRQYFEEIRPLQLTAAASVLTLLCAMLSWHLVEAPALQLKGVSFRDMGRRLLRRKPAE